MIVYVPRVICDDEVKEEYVLWTDSLWARFYMLRVIAAIRPQHIGRVSVGFQIAAELWGNECDTGRNFNGMLITVC